MRLPILLLILVAVCAKHVACHENHDASNRVGPLWLHQTGAPNSTSETQMSVKLQELLIKRLGPNIRASSDYGDFQDIHLNESLEAWRLLETRAGSFARDQALLYEPQMSRLLARANVSSACNSSVSRFYGSIRRLDAWAVQMWSSSGNFPPTGLFDGQFTDLGSYRGCIDIERSTPLDGREKSQDAATFAASYCMLGFRPVVPSRRRFHQIYVKESANLTGLFAAGHILSRATHFAQYFHYLYMKLAVCVPVECSAWDIQQVSRVIGRRLALMPAPVKCITRAASQPVGGQSGEPTGTLSGEHDVEVAPLMINLNRNINAKQFVSLVLLGAFFALVFLVTVWHLAELTYHFLCTTKYSLASGGAGEKKQTTSGQLNVLAIGLRPDGCFKHRWFFYYFSLITNTRDFLDTRLRANEIMCLHGFRVVTMFWIICVHTLQYNDWSGFSRAFENVASLRNPLVQPLINANYVVDNFFLMSGLLAAYTIWNGNSGAPSQFNALRCLLGRYLRLTPQVLLISLAYIVLPLLSNGPFWHDMTHEPAQNCEQNWWINLLHVQSFYRKHQMCNLVGWWISVDMFYYVISLALLWLMLNKRLKLALVSTLLILVYCTLVSAWSHYSAGFTPNNLGTVPQIGEVWSEFVVHFFWSPYPHAFVFFLGLWLGYALANKHGYLLVRRWSMIGWPLSIGCLLVVNYSSRLWIMGTLDLETSPQYVSTTYNIVCVILWSCSFGWIIVACHYGCAPALNRLLSTDLSIMLSKASFIIYLSHMLILRAFYGSQYNLLEVSIATISIILIGMCLLSVLFGVFLCIAFEGPCLKFQRFVLSSIKRERCQPARSVSTHLLEDNPTKNSQNQSPETHKHPLNLAPTSVVLLK